MSHRYRAQRTRWQPARFYVTQSSGSTRVILILIVIFSALTLLVGSLSVIRELTTDELDKNGVDIGADVIESRKSGSTYYLKYRISLASPTGNTAAYTKTIKVNVGLFTKYNSGGSTVSLIVRYLPRDPNVSRYPSSARPLYGPNGAFILTGALALVTILMIVTLRVTTPRKQSQLQ